MKLAGIVAAVTALAVGAAVALSTAKPFTVECQKPLTLMESEINGAIEATETYIAEEIAPLFNKPAGIDWYVVGNGDVKPGRIVATNVVGEEFDGWGGFGGESRMYEVELVRDCAGGEWKVVKFELAKGQAPEPKSSGADSRPRQPA